MQLNIIFLHFWQTNYKKKQWWLVRKATQRLDKSKRTSNRPLQIRAKTRGAIVAEMWNKTKWNKPKSAQYTAHCQWRSIASQIGKRFDCVLQTHMQTQYDKELLRNRKSNKGLCQHSMESAIWMQERLQCCQSPRCTHALWKKGTVVYETPQALV